MGSGIKTLRKSPYPQQNVGGSRESFCSGRKFASTTKNSARGGRLPPIRF